MQGFYLPYNQTFNLSIGLRKIFSLFFSPQQWCPEKGDGLEASKVNNRGIIIAATPGVVMVVFVR
jgi:hypothetical protein